MFVSDRVETPFEADFLPEVERGARAGRSDAAERPFQAITLSVHDNLDAVETDWRRFEATADGTVFQTFDWLSAWQQTIGSRHGVRPVIVVGKGPGGDILFLLPLAIEKQGPMRTLTFLGSDLCDYNGPLLAPGFASRIDGFAAIWSEIGRLLRSDKRYRHNAIVLTKMPDHVGEQLNPLLSLATTLHSSGAYLTVLGEEWDKFYAAKRSSSWRKRDRWKRKRLGDHGAVALDIAGDESKAAATLQTLFEQKSRAFARMGVPNFFARPGHTAFFLDLAARPTLRDKLHVSALTVAGKPVAANFGLMRSGRFYHILVSYDDGELSRFGPGAVHLQEIMRDAAGRGCGLFDFTVGDEAYKREWSDTTLALYDHRMAVTPLGLAIVLPAVAAARVKRLIKQTPFLWRAAVRARALIGALTGGNRKAGAESDSDQT